MMRVLFLVLAMFFMSVGEVGANPLPSQIVIFDGDKEIINAGKNDLNCSYDEKNVFFKLDDKNSKIFEEYTANNIGKKANIYVCGDKISSPTIRARIESGVMQFRMEDVDEACVINGCDKVLD